MSYHLFSLNLNIGLILFFSFILLIPLLISFIKNKKPYLIIYLSIYLLILVAGVLLDIRIKNSLILISLTISNKWFNNPLSLAYFNPITIIINLFLLFPFGYIFPLFNKKYDLIKIIFLGLIISSLIEFLQFFLPIQRYPELLDILNNLISVILGYLYYLFLNLVKGKRQNDKLSKPKESDS